MKKASLSGRHLVGPAAAAAAVKMIKTKKRCSGNERHAAEPPGGGLFKQAEEITPCYGWWGPLSLTG